MTARLADHGVAPTDLGAEYGDLRRLLMAVKFNVADSGGLLRRL